MLWSLEQLNETKDEEVIIRPEDEDEQFSLSIFKHSCRVYANSGYVSEE